MLSDTVTSLAETNYRNERRRFGIRQSDRRRHLYTLGQTGTGKSTLLHNLIVQDIQNGQGLCVIDPHGDLVDGLLDAVPEHRIDDVIYLDPSDRQYPVSFNILGNITDDNRELVVSSVMAVFYKLWATSWGPRLEYILRNALKTLSYYPEATLLGLQRLLTDTVWRQHVLRHLEDTTVLRFWKMEYEAWREQERNQFIASIQNKVGAFSTSDILRNILGQVHNTIDLRRVMDERKILLVNLSKGAIGEDNSAFLGALLVTKLQLAAMSRIDVPEDSRSDFSLYVDEFQNFATESFATMLAEARKFRLCVNLANQYLTQLEESVRAALFGNIGTLLVFRIGAEDAKLLVDEFDQVFNVDDFTTLGNYMIYLKMLIGGAPTQPFSATTLPPLPATEPWRRQILHRSRMTYARPRHGVERKISRFMQPAAT